MKYTILSILFAFAALTSCIDDDLICVEDTEVPEDITNGYSLNFTVTLDKMGGTRSIEGLGNPMEDMEDYVDLEKFRVLFFNKDDKFLFESKSRWVKRLTPTSDDHSRWFVSVPVFSYGNDAEENWKWKEIRETLRTEEFKIAILANRPGMEMSVAINLEGFSLPEEWFNNTGPQWGANDAVGAEGEPKDVFDLHHSQYDAIYYAKSYPDVTSYNNNDPYYSFITGKDEDGKPTMSSTSSWVDWNREKVEGMDVKYFIQPSEDHPIPMYGFQRFNPLEGWKEGTTFNLTRDTDKPIALLRSVVKLELIFPKKENTNIEFARILYPNIYARCEPMNVWTPTDELWGESHDGLCPDWNHLAAYGPVSRSTDSDATTSKEYQERMLWFYGAWREKGWPFESHNELNSEKIFTDLAAEGFGKDTYPQIFNPCIQRNTAAEYDTSWDFGDNKFHRYIVYVGERNINDPTNLSKMGADGNGSPTIIFWRFKQGNNVYNIPLTDFANVNDFTNIISYEDNNTKNSTTGVLRPVSTMNTYEKEVQKMDSEVPKPWPLIRNHVYRITLTTKSDLDYHWDFSAFGYKTQNDITAATNWSNPGGGETKVLSYDDLNRNTNLAGQDVTIKWWENDGFSTKPTLAKGIFGTEDHNINGNTPIKIGSGVQATLTVPNEKRIKELTLRSYIDVKDYVDAKKTLSWEVSSAPKEATPYYLKSDGTCNNTSTDKNVLQFAFGSMASNKADFGIGWKKGSGAVEITYDNKKYTEFKNYAVTEDTNGSNNSSLAADGSSQANYMAFVPKYSGKLIIVVHNNGGKNTCLYEDGMQKAAKLIGNGDKSITFNGNEDLKPLNGNNNYTGGILVDVQAGSTYTISVNGSKGRWEGFIYDYEIIPESTDECYWAEVLGKTYNGSTEENNMSHFYGQSYYDEHTFDNLNTNKVTFTNSNSGKDVCFIASVRTENANGKPEYWELIEEPNNEELKAKQESNGNITINEFRGLKFKNGSVRIYDREENNFCLVGNTIITFPSLSKAYTITIKGRTAVDGTTPSIVPVNTSATSGQYTFNNDESTFTWEVDADATVQLQITNNDNGVYLYKASVEPQSGNGARATRATDGGLNFKIKSEDLHSKSIRFD